MILIKIKNIKSFTSTLLVKDTFNEMLLTEATICTHSTFTIDGHTNRNYYNDEDEMPDTDFNKWSILRPICYELIKGKHLPSYFKYVFKLSQPDVETVISSLVDYTLADVDGLFLNIKYDKGEINIVTGTSMKTFLLDKSVEKAFDSYICEFLNKYNIEYDIC